MLVAEDGKGVAGMDILHLIERLEGLALTSPRMPMMGRVMIDPQELLELVDQMRIALPESVHQAQRLLEERGRGGTRRDSLFAPNTEPPPARRDQPDRSAPADARPRPTLPHAEREAEQIIDQARKQADAMLAEAETQRQGADQYSSEVLESLESQLASLLSQVRRGMEALERQRPASH